MMNTVVRRGAVAGMALLICSVAAAAQTHAPVDPATVPELRAEFARAEQLGLNVAPLIAKARQGYLASASTNRVRDAVRGMTDRLVAAREALAPVQADGELEAGANAMQHGVSRDALRQLRAIERSRSLIVPLGVLQDLVEVRGVSVKDAMATVVKLVRNRVADTQIAMLGRNVQGDVALGLAPSVAMEVRLKGVLSLPQGPLQGTAVAPNRQR